MRNLASFKNIHNGETVIVCGCGSSLNDFEHPERFITIGVNDVSRRFHPDYLVVVDHRRSFNKKRFEFVKNSRARYLFSQLDPGPVRPETVQFRLGRKGGTDFSNPNVLNYSLNSPYVAMCLAVHMGASRIGVIGVDFTLDHFFGKTGRHRLTPHLPRIDSHFKRLGDELERRGIRVINLSPRSRITAFKKGDIENLTGCSP